ncbi:MAG: FAD-dependent monooxygenase [Bacteroides sp.]|nr:FAD-dependent monooxygenase [Eubacterium sp.]MCM1417318.1 FAD-dependent monooxygenase [Roseburia sp.]MCM1461489.1 FAD-dependent monooxygenase [Bacteroides sp.]
MYDVIVVGAGPAGCTAAKLLAERGRKVLLAERFALPRNKSCSGVLIRRSVELIERYFGEVPPFALCEPNESRGMILTDEGGRTETFEQAGVNIWRSDLDWTLALKAAESGAELLEETPVLSVEEAEDYFSDEYVKVTFGGAAKRTETARYVLNCEGAAGALRKGLLGAGRELISTLQVFCHGSINLDPRYFYAFLQPALSEYDAWFNVKDRFLILGVAGREAKRLPLYLNRFFAFLEENYALAIEERVRSEKWVMPRVYPGCPIEYGAGRVLFAGEAAGFLNPMGEGISSAIASAAHAVAAIDRRYDDGIAAIYEDYRALTEPLTVYMRRQWSFIAERSAFFAEMKER